ncbi:hypothetical protein DL546_002914 [Coniochaeta pulveracea]|uniref:Uncharacterized protein n=1 Tax=Coniochaeta pulveracea TaxID=177199 RepID=A0A420YCL8_9PEZI|nr:hypothetical protein DL546_002914 [Coniochaeta pulveracea]
MKFTILSFVTLITVALAFTEEEPSNVIKRQDIGGEIPANVAVMTDADGNVVTFDPNAVHLDSLAKGL